MRGWIRPLAQTAFAMLVGAITLAAAAAPRVIFTDTKLKNGLRVIISEDHTAPVYSIAVTYNVGSRDERKGRTGFAHLFEHMMFKGSEQVGPGEHFTLVFNNGGSMNGTTNKDRTLYFETLPSNQLDLGLFLEADRMWSLEITKENLDNQRNAVQEERRLGLDNQPYGKSFELIEELAYENPAYEHSVIGSMADLSAATVEDVSAFFKTYYAPNNAVVSIVGDVKTAEVLEKMRKYFERIPSQPAPAPVDMTEPAQTAERRQTVDDALARLPRVDMVWHTPAALAPDDDALTVMAAVLSSGRSSRFYDSIVRVKQLSSGVGASAADTRGPGLFQVGGTALPGKNIADLEAAIYAEIDKLKTEPVAAWELEKARNNWKRSSVAALGQFAAAGHHARPLRALLERSESHQHVPGPHRGCHRRRRPARRQAVFCRDQSDGRDDHAEGALWRSGRGRRPAMKLRHLAIGVLMAALAMTGTPGRIVAAQQAPPPPQPPLPTKSQPVVLKGRAPVSKEVLQVKLPRPAEADSGERPARHGARRSAAAADLLSDSDSRRRRLLRSRRLAGARGGDGGDDARRHDVAHDAADFGVARDEGGHRRGHDRDCVGVGDRFGIEPDRELR